MVPLTRQPSLPSEFASVTGVLHTITPQAYTTLCCGLSVGKGQLLDAVHSQKQKLVQRPDSQTGWPPTYPVLYHGPACLGCRVLAKAQLGSRLRST